MRPPAAPRAGTSDSSPATGRTRSSHLLLFFVLSYALMWVSFGAVAYAGIPARSAVGGALLLLGAFAPGLSALWLTGWAEGREGVADLLRRTVQWRVAVRWYLLAVFFMAAVKLSAAVVHRVVTGTWPRFGHEALVLIVVATIVSTPFQAGEELGWRGYALPRLAARMGLARASLLLGVIWGVWHLPQFFVRGADTYRQSFPLFVLQVIALSVALAWLWDRTGRSLLLPMLMHAAGNNSKDIVPSAVPGGSGTFGLNGSLIGWTTVGLLWVCAAYFLLRMSRQGPEASTAPAGGEPENANASMREGREGRTGPVPREGPSNDARARTHQVCEGRGVGELRKPSARDLAPVGDRGLARAGRLLRRCLGRCGARRTGRLPAHGPD